MPQGVRKEISFYSDISLRTQSHKRENREVYSQPTLQVVRLDSCVQGMVRLRWKRPTATS